MRSRSLFERGKAISTIGAVLAVAALALSGCNHADPHADLHMLLRIHTLDDAEFKVSATPDPMITQGRYLYFWLHRPLQKAYDALSGELTAKDGWSHRMVGSTAFAFYGHRQNVDGKDYRFMIIGHAGKESLRNLQDTGSNGPPDEPTDLNGWCSIDYSETHDPNPNSIVPKGGL